MFAPENPRTFSYSPTSTHVAFYGEVMTTWKTSARLSLLQERFTLLKVGDLRRWSRQSCLSYFKKRKKKVEFVCRGENLDDLTSCLNIVWSKVVEFTDVVTVKLLPLKIWKDRLTYSLALTNWHIFNNSNFKTPAEIPLPPLFGWCLV